MTIHQPLAKRLRWRLEAVGLRILLRIMRGQSHKTIRKALHTAMPLAQPLLRNRINTACLNLERVYDSQLNTQQTQDLAKSSMESFLLASLESIIKPVPDTSIKVEGEGLDELLEAHRHQRPIILASLHLGCWDIALRWLSQQLPSLAVVYKPASNPFTDPLLNSTRSANSNCLWIPLNDSLAMARHLRRGGALVLMSDLPGKRNALTADFLGLETRFTPGPMRLSHHFKIPLVPAAQAREDDGTFRVIFGKAIQPSGSVENQAAALARWQETWVHRYADQYYWINRRWRKDEGRRLRPPATPSERVLQLLRR